MGLRKRSYDQRLMSVDLGPALRSDETISGIDSIEMSANDTNVTLSDKTYSSTGVTFKAADGDAGHHVVVIKVNLAGSPSQRLQANVPLVVE